MSVTDPKGFSATGVVAGLKASGEPDLALVVNLGHLRSAAGVFTANRVQAAPVAYSRAVLAGGQLDAVVLNSGGANACTGPQGHQDAMQMAQITARATGTSADRVAVCSTGLIGQLLPMPKVVDGIRCAAAQLGPYGDRAAAAIMTTDTVPKTTVVTGPEFCVGGMAKGAGMLAPGLATMLVVLTTDAVTSPAELDTALRAATALTFDRLDSDGAMSTNDTVLLMASGASRAQVTQQDLTTAVTAACTELARQLIGDAEGSTKDIAISVIGAATEDDAVQVGRAIAGNNLVKTAFFGCDPNWGRILAAVGTTSAAFDANRLDVAMNGVWICRAGAVGADRSLVDLTGRQVDVTVDLHAGDASATIWTNDLSHAYVHENSAYST